MCFSICNFNLFSLQIWESYSSTKINIIICSLYFARNDVVVCLVSIKIILVLLSTQIECFLFGKTEQIVRFYRILMSRKIQI